jgi:hypothetical protein
MSPVSKIRKSKKHNTQRSSYPLIAPESAAPRERPSWFATSIEAVLGNTGTLLAATGPREAEQATCELLGEQLYRAVHEVRSGLWFDWWFEELAATAAARVRNSADLGGEWRLLHGLAAVGPPALRSVARHHLNGLLKVVRRRPEFARQPRWLALLHLVRATGEVWRMQDTYGTRIALIAGMSYPHGADPSVFLFDIDASGFTTLANAGSFDDVRRAAAAWRAYVGDTADGVEPVEVRSGEELSCLAYCDTGEDIMGGVETRDRMDNWFRANRCAHDLAHALRKGNLRWPATVSLYHDLDTAPMVTEFTTWYTGRHGAEPDAEVTEALAEEWLEGKLPETRYSISPQRIAFQRQLIDDGWIPDHPLTTAVRPLFGEWVRWLGERSGLAADLIERATAEIGVSP